MGNRRFLFSLAIVLLHGLAAAEAIPVSLIQQDGRFELLRNGQPYHVRGAGGTAYLDNLKAAGGNSIRTWGDVDREFLDQAHALGLSVCVGLWVEHERHGFDYGDSEAVEQQIARHCSVIDQFKDHPAVLLWGIGNEVELQSTDPRVWDVIEAIASYAKKKDPNHPTMTVVAHAPAEAVHHIMQRAPSIDILGCNSYGGIFALADDVRKTGWPGPYLITEWGTDGMWEVQKTAWGAEIEPSSTEKARQIRERYALIQSDPNRCLGSYVFYWGSKQETTPTWFNLFLESGERMEAVDALQSIWTGFEPVAQAPRINHLKMNQVSPDDSLVVKATRTLVTEFSIENFRPPALDIRWELLLESSDKRLGGDREQRPGHVPLQLLSMDNASMAFVAPSQPGNYRLYLYVYAPRSRVATANFPFQVVSPLP